MSDTLEKNEAAAAPAGSFIDDIIREELEEGGRCHGRTVHTRFPPNPTATCISAMPRPCASILERR